MELATYIDRQGDTARVTIYAIETSPKYCLGKKLADYETASRGAKASARKTEAELLATGTRP